jgi:hypothetical protein
MFEKLTDRARRVLVLAQQEARDAGHDEITPDHVLLGCAVEHDGVAGRVLDTFGLSAESLRARVQHVVPRRSRVSALEAAASVGVDLLQVKEAVEEAFGAGSLQLPGERPPFAAAATAVLQSSVDASLDCGHNYVGTEHLLLGLLRDENGAASASLAALGVDAREVEQRTRAVVHRYTVVEQQHNRARARDLRRGVQRLPAEQRPAAREILNETVNAQPTMPLVATDADFETWLSTTDEQLGDVVDRARARLDSIGTLAFVDAVASLMKTGPAARLESLLEGLRDERDALYATDSDDEAAVAALSTAVRRERSAAEIVNGFWTSLWVHHDDWTEQEALQHVAAAVRTIEDLP